MPLASSNDMVKLASKDTPSMKGNNLFEMFKDVIDMREAGIDSEAIICKIADHYEVDVMDVASVHKLAVRQAMAHNNIVYTASAESFKKKVVAVKISSDPMVAITDTRILPVYNKNGVFTSGSSSAEIPLPQPIAAFPVPGVKINDVPVFANRLVPEIVGTQYAETIYFTLKDIGDVAENIMDMQQFEDFVDASIETGLVQGDTNQLMTDFRQQENPMDEVTDKVVEEAGIGNLDLPNPASVNNLAVDSVEGIQNPTQHI